MIRKELDFFNNRKVLITGHTGFKGSWLCELLLYLGADVYGYALKPEKNSIYELSHLDDKVHSYYKDIRDYDELYKCFKEVKPEIVIHMAAQSTVGKGYEDPKLTYDTNINGVLNVLECLRNTDTVRSFVNITTDKVYADSNTSHKEDDLLDGFDPYSNSKSCSELITRTYRRCFFENRDISISSLRAGNVIGGADSGENRLIPDAIRAYVSDQIMKIRNPYSTRPYQHVIEVLLVYLLIIKKQYDNKDISGEYNVSVSEKSISSLDLIEMFSERINDNKFRYEIDNNKKYYEADNLSLDNSKTDCLLGYKPLWNIEKALDEVCDYACRLKNKDNLEGYLEEKINEYFKQLEENEK